MSTVLWIVGEPGIGKTTLARELIQSLTGKSAEGPACEIVKPKWTLLPSEYGSVAAAGHWRGTKFDGADTLPISDIKPAMEYWRLHFHRYFLTIIDGDKLSTKSAIDIVRATGSECACILLDDPGRLVAGRRREARGTSQDPRWVKGRRTKAHRFFDTEFNQGEKLGYDVVHTPLTEIVEDTLQLIHA